MSADLKNPRYLLLGWKARKYAELYRRTLDPQKIDGEIVALVRGTGEQVIAAASAAPCGILLVDLYSVPTAKSLAQALPAGISPQAKAKKNRKPRT